MLTKARASGLGLTFQDKNSSFGCMGERRPLELLVQLLFECKVERVSNSKDFLEKTWSYFCPVLNFGGLDACSKY